MSEAARTERPERSGWRFLRDLAIIVNAAASVAGKVPRAGNSAAHEVAKDLMLVHNEVAKFGKMLQRSYNATKQTALALVPTKQIVATPLKLSREPRTGSRPSGFRRSSSPRLGTITPTVRPRNL